MTCKHFAVFISGPTGVGKSDLTFKLAQLLPAEIINADVGQFYTPLSIGTAKPDWRNSPIPHHLFDILDEPKNFTVGEYRKQLLGAIKDIAQRGKLPIVVGGSGFYLKSLFFPPKATQLAIHQEINKRDDSSWQTLNEIDPKRAAQIHKNDRYRIERALKIWEITGIKPSDYQPTFDYPANFLFIWVEREREKLYERINSRTHIMLNEGWLQEVVKLKGTAWEPFLQKKKLIGYDLILNYLDGPQAEEDYRVLSEKIQKLTRNYAKRQMTFWRMFSTELKKACNQDKPASRITSVNLTLLSLDLYISQLSDQIKKIGESWGEK